MQCEILSFSPSTYSESSTSILQVKFSLPSGGLWVIWCEWYSSVLFVFFVALPQHQDKNIRDNSDRENKINQENNRRLSLVTKRQNNIRIMNTSYKPGKKTPNCEQKIIFQDLNGKTVVALRCCGAHWDWMWLMHRIKGTLAWAEPGSGGVCHTFFYSSSSPSSSSLSSFSSS